MHNEAKKVPQEADADDGGPCLARLQSTGNIQGGAPHWSGNWRPKKKGGKLRRPNLGKNSKG